MADLRKAIESLAAVGEKSVRADKAIKLAAAQRRDVIDARLGALKPLADAPAGAEYQALIAERGQIDTILGRAPR